MITTETEELLRQLRGGTIDSANVAGLEKLSAMDLINEMRDLYPIMFQERRIGSKYEVGLARSRKIEFTVRRLPNRLFAPAFLHPVLTNCLFLSGYDDSISEISVATSLHVHARGGSGHQVVLKMGKGLKLDRTPDGWTTKPLKRRSVTLTEEFLAKRGWKFEALLS